MVLAIHLAVYGAIRELRMEVECVSGRSDIIAVNRPKCVDKISVWFRCILVVLVGYGLNDRKMTIMMVMIW